MSDSAHRNRASVAQALEEEERLRRLDAERAETKARAEALRAQQAAFEPPVTNDEQQALNQQDEPPFSGLLGVRAEARRRNS